MTTFRTLYDEDSTDEDFDERRRHLHRTAATVGYRIRRTYARELRQRLTLAEAALWDALRCQQTGGGGWRRQHIVGRFIVDFVHLRARIAVEVDGGYHDTPHQQVLDGKRDEWLREDGWAVVRYRNENVLAGAVGVAEALAVLVRERGGKP